MSSRDVILADFQACSGIEDVGEAFMLLEAANWNLLQALNSVLPQEMHDVESSASMAVSSDTHPSTLPQLQQQAGVITIDSPPDSGPSVSDFPSAAGTSSEPSASLVLEAAASSASDIPDVIDINMKILSDNVSEGNSFPLELPATATVGELQAMLHQLVGITPCAQVLEGFRRPVDEETVITTDLLPESKTLTLNASQSVSFSHFCNRINGAHNEDYLLLIHDENSGRDYRLHYPGSKKVKDIKSNFFDLSNIAVRHQQWTGWPPNIDEENATLTSSGISKQHHLTVRRSQRERTPRTHRKVVVEASEDNSSNDEFEDTSELLNEDDDFLEMIDVPPSSKQKQLIPSSIEDDMAGVVHFCEEFKNRYGSCIPMFFQGTLEDAVKESLMPPAKRRKLLAVYLHHDGSVLSNVFCSQALCHISVVDYLSANFLIWGWDLTHEANKARLLNQVITHFGTVAASTVRGFTVEKLPALLVMTRTRGVTEVLSVINGSGILDEVMTALVHAVEMFEERREMEIVEEGAREAREAVKAEQDAAYMASLEADRAKAAAKKQEEEDEKHEKERQASIRQQEEEIKQAVRASLKMDLPNEPGPDCKEAVMTLRFRAPGNNTFCRSFLAATPLQVVLNYLYVKGYAADEYKCLLSWPRRDITTLDTSKSLNELKFHPQETLNLEER